MNQTESETMSVDQVTEHYVPITEIAGDSISSEQYQRMVNRYHWAKTYAIGKDVLEIACGSGQGLELINSVARSLTAGDYSAEVLDYAEKAAPAGVQLKPFDACDIPFDSEIFDLVIMFEAIYYVEMDRFLKEAHRILRPGGRLLITTPNKDLYDFNPSPHSIEYAGVVELEARLSPYFEVACFGDTPLDQTSLRQRILRPVKALASRLGVIPKTMHGKALLKKLFFGDIRPMPAQIDLASRPVSPTPINLGRADQSHKVLYCAARKAG